jgi:hypothetical protein
LRTFGVTRRWRCEPFRAKQTFSVIEETASSQKTLLAATHLELLSHDLATYHFWKKQQNAGLRSMPLASVFEQREKMYRNPVFAAVLVSILLRWRSGTRPTDSSK